MIVRKATAIVASRDKVRSAVTDDVKPRTYDRLPGSFDEPFPQPRFRNDGVGAPQSGYVVRLTRRVQNYRPISETLHQYEEDTYVDHWKAGACVMKKKLFPQWSLPCLLVGALRNGSTQPLPIVPKSSQSVCRALVNYRYSLWYRI